MAEKEHIPAYSGRVVDSGTACILVANSSLINFFMVQYKVKRSFALTLGFTRTKCQTVTLLSIYYQNLYLR